MAAPTTIRRLDEPRANPFTLPSEVDIGSPKSPITINNGVSKAENPDGSATIDFAPKSKKDSRPGGEFYKNLADDIDQTELDRIAMEILEGVEIDKRSRQEWMDSRTQGIKLLALKLNAPKNEFSEGSVSSVQHPVLLENTLRFQANARGELLPAGGPVKIRNDTPIRPKPPIAPPPPQLPPPMPAGPPGQAQGMPPMGGPQPPQPPHPPMMPPGGAIPPPIAPHPMGPPQAPPPAPPAPPPTGLMAPPAPVVPQDQKTAKDEIAEAFEIDMNHFLTAVATEYYPDTDRMLFWVGAGGIGIKKVYNCPLKRRPVSISVDAEDLIVNNASTDLTNCTRITHRIKMPPSTLKRMQYVGAYRDIEIPSATALVQTEVTDPQREKNEVAGYEPQAQKPGDADHEIYECYCELDIDGFEHKDKRGDTTGLQLPYIVSVHRESRQILEVRRNWEKKDDLCLPRQHFVDFQYVQALGFYGIGLIHILGNITSALTAAWRIIIDAGMFANFPGFIVAKSASRQLTNEFRVPPGGSVKIETGGTPLNQLVMPLPYKEAGAGFIQFIQHLEEVAMRVGGTADIQIGEGKQDAPVGTTLALLEQATKVVDAVHKRLHASQAREFQLLKQCFKEDPEAFWRFNNKPAMPWDKKIFLQALDDCNMVPVSDPNNPTSMHRIAKAVAIKTLQQGAPDLYDPIAVDTRIMRIVGIDPEGLFKQTPSPPPPNPSLIAAQAKAKASEMQNNAQMAQLQLKAQIQQAQSQDKAADRASREKIEQLKMMLERLRIVEENVIHGSEGQGDSETLKAATQLILDHAQHSQQLAHEQQQHEDRMALEHKKHSDQMELDRQTAQSDQETQRHEIGVKADVAKHTADVNAQASVEAAKVKPPTPPTKKS